MYGAKPCRRGWEWGGWEGRGERELRRGEGTEERKGRD
jgi:hypothetical protein